MKKNARLAFKLGAAGLTLAVAFWAVIAGLGSAQADPADMCRTRAWDTYKACLTSCKGSRDGIVDPRLQDKYYRCQAHCETSRDQALKFCPAR